MPILYSGICCVFPLVYLIAPKDFKIIWLSNQLSIPDKGYSRNLSVVYREQFFPPDPPQITALYEFLSYCLREFHVLITLSRYDFSFNHVFSCSFNFFYGYLFVLVHNNNNNVVLAMTIPYSGHSHC
jgi:hypothetical protein